MNYRGVYRKRRPVCAVLYNNVYAVDNETTHESMAAPDTCYGRSGNAFEALVCFGKKSLPKTNFPDHQNRVVRTRLRDLLCLFSVECRNESPMFLQLHWGFTQ